MKKTIKDVELAGKRVLLRVDFNVLIENQKIVDDTRIQAALPTIRYLIEHQARVMILSHLGRRSGFVVEELRMNPVAERLAELLQMPVEKLNNCIGPEVREAAKNMQPGQVIFLENVRFHPGEMVNDLHFAQHLAEFADLYVDDAFASLHRIHASIVGVTRFIPSVAGLLVESEMLGLRQIQKAIQPPVVVILGGARLTDKTHFIDENIERGNRVLVGGVLANTFLKAKGVEVGQSVVEKEILGLAQQLFIDSNGMIELPKDLVQAEAVNAEAKHQTVPANHVSPSEYIVDIGPTTVQRYSQVLGLAKTVIWNGTLGVAEIAPFSAGTDAIARKIASLTDTVTIAGGGSTLTTIRRLGLNDQFNHLSTGGSPFLLALANKPLPGLMALQDKDESQSVSANSSQVEQTR